MAYVTQSEAENDTSIDPYFRLILNDDLAQNKYPEKLSELKADPKHVSLMAKTITPELFEQYKDHRTATAGWSLARAINTGVCYPSSFVGCHAGDVESYEDFKFLFQPVIEAYHVGYKLDGSMQHITDMDATKITTDLVDGAKSKVISTRIRVARNLSFFPLNPGGTKETRLEIADLMEQVFAGLPDDLAGHFYRHTTMTPEETQQLIDDHFLFRGKDKMQAASGYHADWPHGRGIFVSHDKKFLLWINEGDHLRIISMEKGGNVKPVFERLSRGIKAIEDGLKRIKGIEHVFSCDPILGLITCCPSNLGTGMRGSVHILVPKLIQKIGFDEIDKIARSMNCQARGSTGEHSEVVDRIDISNWRRLGFKECDLVQDMIRCANKLAAMEDEVTAVPEHVQEAPAKQNDEKVPAKKNDEKEPLLPPPPPPPPPPVANESACCCVQ
jgi:protein-arginine kinase